MATHSSTFCLGLAGYSPRGCKESDTTEHLSVSQMKPHPKPNDRCPYQRKAEGSLTQRGMGGERPREDRKRLELWSHEPSNVQSHPKLEEARKWLSQRFRSKLGQSGTPFQTSGPQSSEGRGSVVSSCPVHGNLPQFASPRRLVQA